MIRAALVERWKLGLQFRGTPRFVGVGLAKSTLVFRRDTVGIVVVVVVPLPIATLRCRVGVKVVEGVAAS